MHWDGWSHPDASTILPVIEKTMRRFTTGRHPTAVFERFSDDLFGHRNALSILVYTDKGKLTKAFLTYLELHRQLENYPLLDETESLQSTGI